MIKIFNILFLLFFCLNVWSQKAWTLDDCINYAIEHNLQIKLQEVNVKVSKNNYLQSYAEMAPSIGASGSHSINAGRSVNESTYEYINQQYENGSFGVVASLTLFNGFQTYNSIRQNRFNLLANLQVIEKTKNDIKLNITGAYLQILLDIELLENAKNQLIVTQSQVDRTKPMVDMGKVAKGEYLNIKALEAKEKENVTNSSNNLKLSYFNLTQLLNLDSIRDFMIETSVNINIDDFYTFKQVNEIYKIAETTLPEIKSAIYQLKSSEKNLAITQGQRSPQIYLKGTYSSWYNETARGSNPWDSSKAYLYNDQLKDNLRSQISLNINIPIFDNLLIHNKIRNARLSVISTQIKLDQTKQILYKEIQQAHIDAIVAKDAYDAKKVTLASIEEAFNYAEQKFKLGLLNSVDYQIAKNNLTNAQSELLQGKYTYLFKIKILDFYSGKPIKL